MIQCIRSLLSVYTFVSRVVSAVAIGIIALTRKNVIIKRLIPCRRKTNKIGLNGEIYA